jgi:hypothetical protein
MQQIEGVSDDDKTHLIAIIDAFIRNINTRKEYNHKQQSPDMNRTLIY